MLQHEAHRRNFVPVGKTEIPSDHALGSDDLGRVVVSVGLVDLHLRSLGAEQIVHQIRAQYKLGELNRYGLIEAHLLAEGLDILFRGIERHQHGGGVPGDLKHREHDDQYRREHDEALQETSDDISAHGETFVDKR